MQDSRFKHPLALILLIRIRISRVLHLPMPKGLLCETIVNCNSVMVDNYNSVIVEKNIYPPPILYMDSRGVFRFQRTSDERNLRHR